MDLLPYDWQQVLLHRAYLTPRGAPLRQHISDITLSLSFLGHPAPWSIRLVTYSVIAESRQEVTPFHVLIGL